MGLRGGGGDPPVWFQRGATRKGDLTAQNEEERGEGGQKRVKSHSTESRGRVTYFE